MSKTTPVRWWRDDSTRYVTRGPQTVPEALRDDVQWAFDLIASSNLDLPRIIERQRELISRACDMSIRFVDSRRSE